jgi:hypothetical protein
MEIPPKMTSKSWGTDDVIPEYLQEVELDGSGALSLKVGTRQQVCSSSTSWVHVLYLLAFCPYFIRNGGTGSWRIGTPGCERKDQINLRFSPRVKNLNSTPCVDFQEYLQTICCSGICTPECLPSLSFAEAPVLGGTGQSPEHPRE